MPLKITIDAFSGRENPTATVEGPDEAEILARVEPADKVSPKEVVPVPESILGYRGVLIEQLDGTARGLPKSFRVAGGLVTAAGQGPAERAPRLYHRPADPFVEEFICGSTGAPRFPQLEGRPFEILGRQILEIREIDWVRWWRPIKPIKRFPCACAPLYEPDWWNDGSGGQKQPNNNCYNYGTNYRTDTFAQPGRASGQMYPHPISCSGVRPAAIRDDLIDNPKANNRCPKEGHLVALVVGPGWDYHWYRKGRNGRWTHKPGGTPVTDRDNSGNPITDPRTADRGNYTDFCTFMTVMHGHIKIG